MIKANELRIGNWILFDNMLGGKRELQVTPRMFRQLGMDLSENLSLELSPYHTPIPLTEEWLLKFGFEKKDTEWVLFPCFEVQIIVFNDEKYNGTMFYTRTIHTDYKPIYTTNYINNVHELQNLYFALTGEELTIK